MREFPDFGEKNHQTLDFAAAIGNNFSKADYVCAITLGGAAEELLGKLVEERGEAHALDEMIKACNQDGVAISGEKWPPKTFASMANHFRNNLKHLGDGEPMEIPKDAAGHILDRAISNYFKLTGNETELMKRFMRESHGP